MPEFKSHPQGTFSWTDLGTPDPAGAKNFYSTLFDWTYVDQPMGPDSFYTMFQKNGKTTAALYPQVNEQKTQGMPPHWMTYIAVNNVDESTAKATSLGATVAMPPFDVFEAGRMAVVQDPSGAFVALWQAKNHIGAEVKEEPGSLAWFELSTNDTAKAQEFYTNLLGWGTQSMSMGDGGEYTVYSVGDKSVAGMMKITPEMGPMPPNWSPYFGVESAAESLAKAASLGATVIVPATPIPNIGNFAIFRDPQGAFVSILDDKK